MGRLKAGRLLEAQGEKDVKAAKAAISDWLKKERNVDVSTLKIGEFICIEDVALIEVGKRNKLDEDSFLLAWPTLHAQFKKDFSVCYFKPQ